VASDWSAEFLRLSLFSRTSLSVSDSDWLGLTGQNTSELRQIFPGGAVYGGKVDSNRLQISANGGRLDVIMAPNPEPDALDTFKLPTIGPWVNSRDRFIEKTRPWLESSQMTFSRIAVGASLVFTTGSALESITELKNYLHSVKGNMNEASEFLMRVNWPQTSSVINDLRLNRITQWTAAQVIVQTFPMIPPAIGAAVIGVHSNLHHVVKLEIDHSTDEKRTDAFQSSELFPIYKELMDLASENVLKGERP
jgi:hypothetical protein